MLSFACGTHSLLWEVLIINGSEITSTDSESVKDLGIIVDSFLKFHMHTSTVAAQ